jgi:hypothetical protein
MFNACLALSRSAAFDRFRSLLVAGGCVVAAVGGMESRAVAQQKATTAVELVAPVKRSFEVRSAKARTLAKKKLHAKAAKHSGRQHRLREWRRWRDRHVTAPARSLSGSGRAWVQASICDAGRNRWSLPQPVSFLREDAGYRSALIAHRLIRPP